jgi:hypothetical protein
MGCLVRSLDVTPLVSVVMQSWGPVVSLVVGLVVRCRRGILLVVVGPGICCTVVVGVGYQTVHIGCNLCLVVVLHNCCSDLSVYILGSLLVVVYLRTPCS